jgi:hypothetical protein
LRIKTIEIAHETAELDQTSGWTHPLAYYPNNTNADQNSFYPVYPFTQVGSITWLVYPLEDRRIDISLEKKDLRFSYSAPVSGKQSMLWMDTDDPRTTSPNGMGFIADHRGAAEGHGIPLARVEAACVENWQTRSSTVYDNALTEGVSQSFFALALAVLGALMWIAGMKPGWTGPPDGSPKRR